MSWLLRKIIPKPKVSTGDKIKQDGNEFLKETSANENEFEIDVSEHCEIKKENTEPSDEISQVDYNSDISFFARLVLNEIIEVTGETPKITGFSKSNGFVAFKPLTNSPTYRTKKLDISMAIKNSLIKNDIDVLKVKIYENTDPHYLGSYIVDIDIFKGELR